VQRTPPLSSPYRVRTAGPSDADALAQLGFRTFRETFSKDNTPEDMALYLAEHFGGNLQRAELLDDAVVFLLLEAEGQPSGYVKLRRGAANARAKKPLEVCRFYIDHAWHGRGAALALMQAVEALAVRDGHDELFLAVWENNARAIRFYEKHGFARVGGQEFRLGRELQTDWVMARGL
jgi:ribosomal protein S18 acetylase RimI-like enzyme